MVLVWLVLITRQSSVLDALPPASASLSYEGPPKADALCGGRESGGVAALNRESSTRHGAAADVWARASEGALVGDELSSPRVGAG
jgi:hypothetical protein